MPWSVQIARVFGIPIRMHATFLLLPLLAALAYGGDQGARGALIAALLVPVLFLFVVLHELGHSVVALRFGLRIRDITLLPIGGLARMEDPPRTPLQEILIALAGPAVNFVIAAVLLALTLVLGSSVALFDPRSPGIVGYALAANLALGTFNLFPAFPMDGGRVLRGVLASVLGFSRATRIAARIGQAFGIAGIVVGIARPDLFYIALIGVFVFIGAGQEERASRVLFALEGVPVSRAMIREFEALDPALTLEGVAERVRSGFQEDFPVVREGRLVGLLSRSDLLGALRARPRETQVGEVLAQGYLTVRPDTPLSDLYREMARRQTTIAAVVEGDRLAGLVTLERIARLLAARRGGEE